LFDPVGKGLFNATKLIMIIKRFASRWG